MIRVNGIKAASGAASYFAQDNYYTADESAYSGIWAGQGAEALGWDGAVSAATFEAVLRGELPDGHSVDQRRGSHRPGWDMTVSVPKSVSLVALLGGDHRIVTAFRESTLATLAWAEKNLIDVRSSQGKRQVIKQADNVVAAVFSHDLSRNGEPQLHAHVVIANASRDPGGKWRAIESMRLHQAQGVLGTIQNADLRARIEALGYETVPGATPTHGSFEIAGVPRNVIEAFSTRSAEIAAATEKAGHRSARAREIAALSTRRPKSPELERPSRSERWAPIAREFGFDATHLVDQALARSERQETTWSRLVDGVRGIGAKGAALAAGMGLTPVDGDPLVPERLGRLAPQANAVAQAVASAVRHLSEREAAFTRLDLVRATLEQGGPVTVSDVEDRLAHLERKGLLLGDGKHMLTTAGSVQ